MADALISVLLDPLVSITTEFLKQEVKRVKGVKDDVSSLKSKLVAIKDVLEDAEKKQLEVASVRRWLDQLKDVSYDIDNVLDEWNTEILKSKIQKQNAPVSTKKVCFPLPSSCCFQSPLKKVGVLRKVALEIKKVNETLERIDEDRRRFSVETTKVASNKRRETTSFVDVSEVYGRDGYKDDLISKLLCDSSSQGGKVPVIIPIVGMGGIGKTTLAQLAFNDDKVKAKFNERVWVCVSDPFDETKIAKEILQGLEDKCPDLNSLEALFQRIRKSIAGKKFLLVLDDVWTEDHEKWEQFKQPFRSGAAGSRLVVTTRKETVAILMGAATQMIINLQLLSKEHCWSIFSRLAFSERSSEDCKILEEIGREIASKCKGLPLVAKTLGGLMRFKESKRDWEDVLSDQIWESRDDEIKHFAPFLLSYYDLPPVEKRCFSYCSVFPKDYVFDRDVLIEMWMSQGYLSGDENPEKKGWNSFKNLSMQSFFQDFEKDDDGSTVRCKMHDILHDLTQFLTKNECFTMKVDEEGNTQPPTVEKVRHLTLLLSGESSEFGTSMFDQCNLHSLIVVKNSYISSEKAWMLLSQISSPRIRYLRTLNMRRCGISRLSGQLIGQLRHLRYLDLSENYDKSYNDDENYDEVCDLSYNDDENYDEVSDLSYNDDLEELPDEVCDLCNLQTLRLRGCMGLRRLPEGMGKLVNLRHLHNYGCARLEGLPKGIGRLTQLRTLDRVVIPEKKNDEEFLSIGDLEKMNLQFEKTREIVGCGNLKSLGEAEKLAGLLKRGNRTHPHLHLNFHENDENDENDENAEFVILDALQPPPSLQSLRIFGYSGANLSPKWMTSLDNLTRVKIVICNFFETFPPLGSLPSLEELDIWGNEELRKIGGEAVGITTTTSSTTSTTSTTDDHINVAKPISFPKLRRLEFTGMRSWEEWEGCESATNMPCLHSLTIHTCNHLKSLPLFLKETPLKRLIIRGCNILSESFQRSGKEWAHISHVPNIEFDFKDVKRDGIWMNF